MSLKRKIFCQKCKINIPLPHGRGILLKEYFFKKLLTFGFLSVIIVYVADDNANRGIAQLVEQRSPKPRAEGSSPSAPARKPDSLLSGLNYN